MTFYENTHTHTQIHAFLHLLFQSLFQKFIRFAKHEVLIKIEKHRRFKGALNLYCYAKNSRFILRFENHVCHAFITMQCFRNYRRAALLFHVSHTSLDSRALHSFITSSFICFAAYFRSIINSHFKAIYKVAFSPDSFSPANDKSNRVFSLHAARQYRFDRCDRSFALFATQ